jgi:hypothetical protein
MNSTNEVGIGFHRVDGTAKPELEPFFAIAKFIQTHGELLRERQAEPVVMVIPHTHMFSPRSFAYEATRRCVRAMYYHCGVPLQAVSEYTFAEFEGEARLILVPSPRTLTPQCWEALRERVRRGATVAVTGVVNDEESLPVQQSEAIAVGPQSYLVRFEGEKIQRIEKSQFTRIERTGAEGGPAAGSGPARESGALIRCPLPLELGDSMEALVAFYRMAMARARVAPIFTATPRTPAVLIAPSVFRDVVLYTFVSESNRATTMQVTDLLTKKRFQVTVPAGRTAMVLIDRRSGAIVNHQKVTISPLRTASPA